MADDQPLVSIVVTTKNEEKHIGNCLLSIKEQTYENIETIVVDNASLDRTKEISRQYTDLVFDKGPERSAQRNYGMIDIAQGKYVMFVDADMILSPCLVELCVDELGKGKAVALYISEIILGTSYWCKVRRFERSFYDATVIDSARIYRRDIFCKVGGFDENIDFGEEWDIDKKVKSYGCITLLDKVNRFDSLLWSLESLIQNLGIMSPSRLNVIFHNESEFSLFTYIRKKARYSKGFGRYMAKWGIDDSDLIKQFGLRYRFFVVFFENGKWKVFLRYPFMVVGVYFLRFVVGVSFLLNRWMKLVV